LFDALAAEGLRMQSSELLVKLENSAHYAEQVLLTLCRQIPTIC